MEDVIRLNNYTTKEALLASVVNGLISLLAAAAAENEIPNPAAKPLLDMYYILQDEQN